MVFTSLIAVFNLEHEYIASKHYERKLFDAALVLIFKSSDIATVNKQRRANSLPYYL